MGAQEELRGVEKDVQTCKGVEELAKTSLSEAQEKYKKALQEYEKTYARANPPPEPVTVCAILNPPCVGAEILLHKVFQ